MSGSRWNRRETNVAQAGYFTVLRSAGWFSALSRLPGGYRYVVKGPATPELLVTPEGASAAAPDNHGAAQETAPAFETLASRTSGLGLLRLALIALVAAGLTVLFFLLLHLDSPGS
jgi:hypothetical protein